METERSSETLVSYYIIALFHNIEYYNLSFHPEDGDRTILRNVDNRSPHYMASQPRTSNLIIVVFFILLSNVALRGKERDREWKKEGEREKLNYT